MAKRKKFKTTKAIKSAKSAVRKTGAGLKRVAKKAARATRPGLIASVGVALLLRPRALGVIGSSSPLRSLCPEQTRRPLRAERHGDLRRLPEPKLALCVFWAAGRTPAGQMALFSPASAGLFFGSSDEPACKPKRERHTPSGCHHRLVHAGSDQPGLYR